MALGNIGAQPSSQAWLNKGWSSLRDYAHSAITHFKHDKSDQADHDQEQTQPTSWGILAADVIEHKKEIEIRFEVPGMTKKDLNLEFIQGHLIVKGEKHMTRSRQEGDCFITERAFGHFQRAIPMPCPVNTNAAAASYEEGVLIVKVPKKSRKTGAAIAIQ
ncbi:MAG: HSP20 family protein [Limisphaerales bacterium]|jgi:HSP20 family protein